MGETRRHTAFLRREGDPSARVGGAGIDYSLRHIQTLGICAVKPAFS